MTRPRLRLLSYMVGGFPLSLFERIALVLDADLDYDEERSGPAPGQDPFADGTADLGWICSTSFVDLALRSPHPSIRLAGVAWVPDDHMSRDEPVYFGTLLARRPCETLEELEGATIGCNDEVSLSGHHALRFALRDLGHDPDEFATLQFTGAHRRSLELLLEGALDAAVVDSVVLAEARRRSPRLAGLHTVTHLGPWPTQPLVAGAHLPAPQIAELRDALLASNDDPAMQHELRAAALTRFAPVDDRHYDRVRTALARG